MALSERDIKVLWGRSGGRCAICKAPITKDGADGQAYPIGEQAHVIARSVKGPRGDADLGATERDSADNYILLCPNCHTVVDNDPETWTIDKLRKQKTDHEAEMQSMGKQRPITEFDGRVNVLGVNSKIVRGGHVKSPTRFKPGTRISAEGWGADEVTGLLIEAGEGEEDES